MIMIIYNLKFQNLIDNKKAFSEPGKNLFYKIVQGDKSDCIPPLFLKCGPKTIEKYYLDRELFEIALQRENVQDNYVRNNTLINFEKIPNKLMTEFIEKYKHELDTL